MKKFSKISLGIITTLVIAGCGGGGNGNYSYTTQSNTPNNNNANTTQSNTPNNNDANTTQSNTPNNNRVNASSIITAPIDIQNNNNCNYTLPNDKNSTSYALNYLNKLRCLTQEDNLTLNSNLSNAALNHSKYMNETHEIGHYENNSNASNYSGYSPSDRANNAGYQNTFVGENVSAGQDNLKESINGLFSAIYHRFGFLSYNINEIGIGKKDKFYTYDLGRNSNSYNTPNMAIWPPENAKNIAPVFFNETPDPLPNYSVSGYPVSVEFKNSVNLQAFSLSDKDGNNIDLIKLMDKNNDQNDELHDREYVIFPKNRLEWGSKYYAHLTYTQGGNTHTKNWCFSTTSLDYYANRAYIISDTSNTINLNIKSGESYAIYLKPRDRNDAYNGYHVEYTVSNLDIKLIDGNTIYVKASGDNGRYVNIDLKKNGDTTRTLKLTISSSDSATTPKHEVCP